MKFNITGAKLVKQVVGDRKRHTSNINQTHPDTKGWKLELTPDGLLCTMSEGGLKLIPLTNVIEMDVEVVKAPTLDKLKKSPKKAK